MSEIDQDHLNDLRAHSITSWPKVYLACGFAFVMTFVSMLLLGDSPIWSMTAGFGFLFSIGATIYALTAIGLTTYFEAVARHDYANSIFKRSSWPFEFFIMKEALERASVTKRK